MFIVLFYIIAMTAALRDWREYRISNGCCLGILFITILECFVENRISVPERIVGGLVVSVPMFLLALFVHGSFGGGDIKFSAVCGVFLGWKMMVISTVYAIGAAGVYAVFLLCKGYDRKTRFPLGPFLVLGMTVRILQKIY